jgi:UDP-N-acetylglucosamine:LPS N-acetylglucosamine transferase
LSGERLAEEINSLLRTPEQIDHMELACRKLARRDAAKMTVDLMEELIQNRSR